MADPRTHSDSTCGRSPREYLIAGWMNYYGRFLPVELYPFLELINYLMRWARKKYKRLHAFKRFKAWWTGLVDREPGTGHGREGSKY